jgi:hypothetical protein
MHIQRLAISPISANDSRDDHKLILGYEVPNASFILRGIVLLNGVNVEFES